MPGVEHVQFHVEELSMETALRALLPRVLGELPFDVYTYQGKTDIIAQLPNRLRALATWLPDTHRIVVIVDRDDDDCTKLLAKLDGHANAASLRLRSGAAKTWQIVNRIAIEELEAWYFGDWQAVRAVYPKVPATIPSQAKYRHSDAITGGTWEAFERVLNASRYHVGGLQKTAAAAAIGAHMDLARNTSPSFRKLREVLDELCT
jgi:hypothetical protein